MMLQLQQHATAPAAAALPTPLRSVAPAAVDAMSDALTSEARLLQELASVLRRQRDAVGADDLECLDDSVFATHRILVTLAEARRRRRSVNQLIGAPEELSVHHLERVLGAAATPALREARERLQQAAAALATEVDVNRRVLSDAMAASDTYVRTLYGSARPEVGGAPSPAAPAGGVLLDRTV